jgi:hypothetical protein
MNEALYTFLPSQSSDQMAVWGSLIIVVGCAIALFFLLKKKSSGDAYRRQMLLAMLVFFGLIIAATTGFFSFWSMQKTGPVYIFETGISTPYGLTDFKNISRAYIEMNGQQSMISPGSSTQGVRMLFLEETGGKMHVLSEENYKIDEILNRMRELTAPKQ